MSEARKRLIYFVLPFFLVSVVVLTATDTSEAVISKLRFVYHDTKLLPGTPLLKRGYIRTGTGIRPVVERRRPRAVPISKIVTLENYWNGKTVVKVTECPTPLDLSDGPTNGPPDYDLRRSAGTLILASAGRDTWRVPRGRALTLPTDGEFGWDANGPSLQECTR